MTAKREVLIIGGGVIGMACARELATRGASVTVIDRGEIGHGCSYGNAGWITPCFATPLPRPGMLLKSMGWLLDPLSPLYIKPEPSLGLARWLWGFLLSMRQSKMRESTRALTEISKYSLDAYASLHDETPGGFGFERRGLLMTALTPAGLAGAARDLSLMADFGIPGRKLSREEVHALEPAITGDVAGGVYYPEEAHAEPLQVVRSLARAAEAAGARILPQTEVFGFDISEGRVTGLQTTHGPMKAETILLATGSWSQALGRQLGVRVPVLGGKGYAIVTPKLETATPAAKTPKIPLMVIERKVAITSRADGLRMAGTLELVDADATISEKRVWAILDGARTVLNLPAQPEIREVWRGLRPCTPDGVPIIGFSPKLRNLLIVTGHQMLGLQSAPGTARLAADLLEGVTPMFDPRPFRAERF